MHVSLLQFSKIIQIKLSHSAMNIVILDIVQEKKSKLTLIYIFTPFHSNEIKKKNKI